MGQKVENMKVKLIAKTTPTEEFIVETGCSTAEELISYCARVSNPSNQSNFDTAGKLLKYCLKKKHVSIFEMADCVFEIECSRTIGRQILRHRSFSFQEFSQRYAEPKMEEFELVECRFQDTKNRQSSIEVNPLDANQNAVANVWKIMQQDVLELAMKNYKWAIENNIAKEQARAILPEGLTPSVMYMKGSLRSWIHYAQVRCDMGTQKEHRLVAEEVWAKLLSHFPFLSEMDIMEKNIV